MLYKKVAFFNLSLSRWEEGRGREADDDGKCHGVGLHNTRTTSLNEDENGLISCI